PVCAPFPYTTLFRSDERTGQSPSLGQALMCTALTVPPLIGAAFLLNAVLSPGTVPTAVLGVAGAAFAMGVASCAFSFFDQGRMRSEEHTSELQSREN